MHSIKMLSLQKKQSSAFQQRTLSSQLTSVQVMLVDFVQVESELRTHFSSKILLEVEHLAGVF
jgi:hypothetical protein